MREQRAAEFSREETARQLQNLVAIGIALSAEKDRNLLLDSIVTEARRVTNADAGTLYLLQDDHLHIKIIQNETLNTYIGRRGDKTNLPPVPLTAQYASGYVALTGKVVSVPDVYAASGFDFSGPREYDRLTGYRTTSMLIIPLKNHLAETTGVLQLINARDEAGLVVPFDPVYETIAGALASLAATALTNMQLIQEVEDLFQSFLQVMVTAIDARSPYNATHTKQVHRLTSLIAAEIDAATCDSFREERFDADRLKRLSVAAWLHDIGKIATPLEVMNKSTRLDARLPLVLQRLDYAIEAAESAALRRRLALWREGDVAAAEAEGSAAEAHLAQLRQAKAMIRRANDPDALVDEALRQELEAIARLTYLDGECVERPLLTPEELACLSIPRGTLTGDERLVMQEHVVITGRMLDKLAFPESLALVQQYACMHHEFLDGSGYPRGLRDAEIPLEARILVIADILSALISSDRPYRQPMAPERAVQLLREMADKGKLDGDVVDLVGRTKVWTKLEED